jgi:hypothetical protein
MVGRIMKRKVCSLPPRFSGVERAFCGDAPQATIHCEAADTDAIGVGACEPEQPTKDASMASVTTDDQGKHFIIWKTRRIVKKFARKRYCDNDPELPRALKRLISVVPTFQPARRLLTAGCKFGVPDKIRTCVIALKRRCPGPARRRGHSRLMASTVHPRHSQR